MNLYYNGVALHDYGVVQILGKSTKRLPEDLPQYEVNNLRVRIESFEESYGDNAANIAAIRAALLTQQGTLRVNDEDTDNNYVEREVSVRDDDEPEEGRAPLAGTSRQAIVIVFEWNDYGVTANALGATYTPTGGAAITLGQVHKMKHGYTSNLFDDMRAVRRRAPGQISLTGKITTPSTAGLSVRRADLQAKCSALLASITSKASGTLAYADFSGVVKVASFEAELDQLVDCVNWSLTVTYTRYPNEADYEAAEITIVTISNQEDGTVLRQLTGTIAAPNKEAALAKLDSLRTAALASSSGWVLKSSNYSDKNVSVESDPVSDGDAFLELGFNESWQLGQAGILSTTVKISTVDDVKGYVRRTYSGSVQASGLTLDAAYTAGAAKAAQLGDGKHPLKLSSSIVRADHQVLTTDQVIMTVEFAYEYQLKGDRSYIEWHTERSLETFGRNTETVNGFIMAPTLSAAGAIYTATVRSATPDSLILSEKYPTRNLEYISGVTGSSEDGRFDFSLTVHLDKAVSETSISYQLNPKSNLQTLEKITTVSGTVYAATQAAAEAFLATFLASLSIGTRFGESSRTIQGQQGAKAVGEDKVTAFVQLDFSDTFIAILTGLAGVLETDVTEDIQYSGNRVIEQPLPDGPSVIQVCGLTMAVRTVTGTVSATTEAGARNYARSIRTAMISAGVEHPPRESVNFKFLPQTSGVPRGAGANARLYVCSFTYAESIADLQVS